MTSTTSYHVGKWLVDDPGCRISHEDAVVGLEPKVMDLLLLLVRHQGQVVSREDLLAALWPGMVVGEDTLARTVSKLRQALADDSKQPSYIETVPKRGYRLIAEVRASSHTVGLTESRSFVWLGVGLIAGVLLLGLLLLNRGDPVAKGETDSEATLLANRADDFYMRFQQADNASAIELYERVIAIDPSHAQAHAGLASALVQRVIRWPEGIEGVSSLTEALDLGLNETEQARDLLTRAKSLASRAVQVAPADPKTLKALGLVLATSGDLDGAQSQYQRAISLDDDAWESMINLGELKRRDGDLGSAVDLFSRAYEAMHRRYDIEAQRIGPWHAPLGVSIAELYQELGDLQESEIWYRRILRLSPYDPEATAGLARILAESGDLRGALALCRNLETTGAFQQDCKKLLSQSVTQ